MSKVLFINNYREGTGYSQAGIDFILALDAAGVDVVPRHLTLSGSKHPVPQRILELEKKSSRGADVNIQYTLPNLMSYNGHYKNIALFDYETSGAVDNIWTKQLNLMDQVLVTSKHQSYGCINAGVQYEKLSIVRHASDIAKYQQSYEKLDIPEAKDKFVFYYIGELNKRKNISALLQAFHLEFNPTEPVELLLKVNIPGVGPEQTLEECGKYCEKLKSGMKIYRHLDRYKREIIIPERLTNSDIMRVHTTGDCFVSPSHGEGWSKPAFDAMGMGKTPIVTNTGGMKEFINEETGWLVDCIDEPILGCDNGIPDLYTSNESWAKVNIFSLRKAMREAFENKLLREQKAENGIESALSFRYERVGKEIRKIINV